MTKHVHCSMFHVHCSMFNCHLWNPNPTLSWRERVLEFRHFGLRFLNKSLSFSRNLRPAWMRQTFRTDSCAAASAYPARRGGGVAIFSILAVERNDAFGQARCAANKLRAPCCNKRL